MIFRSYEMYFITCNVLQATIQLQFSLLFLRFAAVATFGLLSRLKASVLCHFCDRNIKISIQNNAMRFSQGK